MRKLYSILAGFTVFALIVYALLPNREFSESIYPLPFNTTVSFYDDQADGGTSVAGISMIDSSFVFKCKLHGDNEKPAWCGLIWDFNLNQQYSYRNWTFVDSLILNIKTENINEMIIKVWAYDPDVTDEQVKTSFRPLIKEIPLKGGVERISVPMEFLRVPAWWYQQNNVNENLKQRHQGSIARFEITPGWEVKRDQDFQIEIISIEAKGLSNLAFGILLFFFLVVFSIAIGYQNKIRR